MLVRCRACGRPLYVEGGRRWAGCGYCYARNDLASEAKPLTVASLDWRLPLREHALLMPPGREQARWLSLMGADALDQRLDLCERDAARHDRALSRAQELCARQEGEVGEEELAQALDEVEGIPVDERVMACARELRARLARARQRREARQRVWRLALAAILAACLLAGLSLCRHRRADAREAWVATEAQSAAWADPPGHGGGA